MAVRRQRLARYVVGYSRKSRTLRQAQRLGAIDSGSTVLSDAVRDADLVVLATPVHMVVPLAKRLLPLMQRGAILTDVGSTKAEIVASLEARDRASVPFIGTHPLAGSEQRGIDAARADLFNGSLCIVTATPRTDRRALASVRRLWRSLVRRVVLMEPQRHDRLLAAVSHLPHLVAFCLVGATEREALALAPRSFLDATRVAKSSPELWDGIFFSNQAAILNAMKRFEAHWRRVRGQLSRGDRAALLQTLARARSARCALERP